MSKSKRMSVSFDEEEVEALELVVGKGKRFDSTASAIRKAVLIAAKSGWPDLDEIEERGVVLNGEQG